MIQALQKMTVVHGVSGPKSMAILKTSLTIFMMTSVIKHKPEAISIPDVVPISSVFSIKKAIPKQRPEKHT